MEPYPNTPKYVGKTIVITKEDDSGNYLDGYLVDNFKTENVADERQRAEKECCND